MKEVKKRQPTSKNFYFTIYTHIKTHNKLPQLSISKQNRTYYLKTLRRANLIKNIGYGVWEVVDNYDYSKLKEVKTSKKKMTQGTTPQPAIRGHAFQFKLSIPKLNNWKKRRDFFKKKNIRYEPLKIIGNGEKIYFRGKKIWLTNQSIIIFDKASYLANTAKASKNYAIYEMLSIVRGLENLFKISLKIGQKYKFKVSKEHYARLSCSLAKQYRKDGKKLSVKQGDGTTWFWTDYSLNIDESETGNTERSDIDMDNHIHPFLTELRAIKGYTPRWVTNSLAELVKSHQYNAENFSSHVRAVQILGSGVGELKKEVKRLRNRLDQKKLSEWVR